MPIYAYRCAACGHAKDVLQKISDPLLTVCPSCGAGRFEKQLTAAGFQLKGSGWYATDFKGGNGGGKPAVEEGDKAATDSKPDSKPASDSKADPAAAPATAPAPATAAAAPAAAAGAKNSTKASPPAGGGSAS